jgi:hypothetical protein
VQSPGKFPLEKKRNCTEIPAQAVIFNSVEGFCWRFGNQFFIAESEMICETLGTLNPIVQNVVMAIKALIEAIASIISY